MWTLGIPSIRQNQIKAPFLMAVLGVMHRLVLSDAVWDRIGQPQLEMRVQEYYFRTMENVSKRRA